MQRSLHFVSLDSPNNNYTLRRHGPWTLNKAGEREHGAPINLGSPNYTLRGSTGAVSHVQTVSVLTQKATIHGMFDR